jgi:tellurite methyltransferase
MSQNETLAAAISKLRRERGLTQEQFAKQLSVTPQAVSKWETGQSVPETVLIPKLALLLRTSIDSLFGYAEQAKMHNPYELWHETDTRYQAAPSQLAVDILRMRPPTKRVRVLHVSCGKGRDTLFLARNGYDVTAFDKSEAAVRMCKELLDSNDQTANVFCADMNDFRVADEYDIVFSTGVLHWTPPDRRQEIFDEYKRHTVNGGLNLWNAFVQKPFIEPAPDLKPGFVDFHTGELFGYYSDWYIHKMQELVYDCDSRGTRHQHCLDILIAEREDT